MAQAFPNSQFTGYDYHDASIERAREAAANAATNGNITFERNTVQTPIKGLNVTVDGPGTRGDINGTMIFRDNLSDKLAVITIDSIGGDMHGDFIATGNRGERIEFGIKGDCSARTVQIENNQLTYKGSPGWFSHDFELFAADGGRRTISGRITGTVVESQP